MWENTAHIVTDCGLTALDAISIWVELAIRKLASNQHPSMAPDSVPPLTFYGEGLLPGNVR